MQAKILPMPSTYLVLLAVLLSFPLITHAAETSVIGSRVQHSEVIEEVPLTGTVVSSRQASLSPEISGLIEYIGIEIGQSVSRGDVILRLKSDLEKLVLEAKQAEKEQTRSELTDAKRRLADAERLGRSNTVSANEINSLQAEVHIREAVFARLQAEERQQQLRLRQHTLRAPFDGVISIVEAEQGEWIVPGQLAAELVSLKSPIIEFQAPQWIYPRLDNISRLQVRFDAIPDEIFEASISAAVPVTDRDSRAFLLRARLTSDNSRLNPGISASATLHINNQTSGVVVDRNALIRYPDGRVTVWTIHTEGDKAVVMEKLVETGISFNGQINITEGLESGEVVVVNGNESLQEGQRVTIKQIIE